MKILFSTPYSSFSGKTSAKNGILQRLNHLKYANTNS